MMLLRIVPSSATGMLWFTDRDGVVPGAYPRPASMPVHSMVPIRSSTLLLMPPVSTQPAQLWAARPRLQLDTTSDRLTDASATQHTAKYGAWDWRGQWGA